MIPVRLQLAGFLSYRDAVDIDFTGVDAMAVVGDNGAGKTSLVEAIAWALYGEGRGRGPDDFVNAMSTLARVDFTFALGDRLLNVRRERDSKGKGKSFLGLFELEGGPAHWSKTFGDFSHIDVHIDVWIPVGGDHIAEVQASIEDLIGLTYDQWITTSYIAQGKADAFTRLTPAGRKDLLVQILDLGRFDLAEERAKIRAAVVDDQLRAAGDRLKGLSDVLATREDVETALEDDRRELKNATDRAADLRTELDGLNAEAAGMAAIADQVPELEQDRDLTQLALNEALAHQAMVPELEAGAKAREAAFEAAMADVQDVLAKNADLEADFRRLVDLQERERAAIDEVGQRIVALDHADAVCPTCNQPLDADRRMALLRKANGEDQEHEQALVAHQVHARDVRAQIIDPGTVQAALARAKTARDDARNDLMEANQLAGRVDDLKERLVAVETRLAAAGDVQDARKVQEAIDVASVALASADRDRTAFHEAIGRLTAQADAIEKAQDEFDDLGVRMPELGAESRDLKTLREAFGRAGVPAVIIDGAVPAIEAEANGILTRLAPRFSVQFRSQKALKSGGIRETLDVIVADDVAERPLDALSGGERQAVDLAVRIGLARMVAARRGRGIQSLFLDEAFTALDAGRRQATIEVIHGLTGEFDQVWFITHDRDIAGAFPYSVQVDQVGGTSTVAIEGGSR